MFHPSFYYFKSLNYPIRFTIFYTDPKKYQTKHRGAVFFFFIWNRFFFNVKKSAAASNCSHWTSNLNPNCLQQSLHKGFYTWIINNCWYHSFEFDWSLQYWCWHIKRFKEFDDETPLTLIVTAQRKTYLNSWRVYYECGVGEGRAHRDNIELL